jgi:acetyl esterase/lipase
MSTGRLRRFYPAVLFIVAVFVWTAPAQQTPPPPTTARMRELVMKPVVYRVPGMERVSVRKDLKYTEANANDPNLLMDVYTPPGAGRGALLPAVIFIHGGASSQYTPKDWGVFTSWGRLVAASGMVGVTFTHRLGYPKPLLAEAAHDVSDAINYVRTNAAQFGVDKDRLCLVAYSAGGPMLSIAMRDRPAYVRCLVAFYAFLDIQQSEPHRANETPEMLRAYSPITYLESDADKLPPLFVARAGLDEVPGMNDSIDRFLSAAIAKNAPLDFANHPHGVHGFDNQTDDARSREIVRRVVEFMKLHLGMAALK